MLHKITSIATIMQIKKLLILCTAMLISGYAHTQSVGLVLSGGGAKGLAHIGVIKALEENNIPIDFITGTSMGAIIGGLYSIGLTPDEMISLFRSAEFNSWFKGEFEKDYATYIYRRDPTAEMFGLNVKRKSNRSLGVMLPTNLISPYPMDLAVMQIFASSNAAAGYDFDRLMVPFRCVAADIEKKRPVIMRRGDLGSAIRASMTYPFVFKPIVIDSVLLFDGGFYNNFPWDVMIEDFDPDIIIGSKTSGHVSSPDTDDIFSQIANMLMVETDYTIPEGKGFLIDNNLKGVGVLDFQKIDEIVKIGYNNAQRYISGMKSQIQRDVSPEKILNKRLAFRTKAEPLIFRDVIVTGKLRDAEKAFIKRTIKNGRDRHFGFEQLKRGYYRVVATDNINTIFPEARFSADSVFDLHLRVTKSAPLKLSIGGNISSSSLNQGYLGVTYNYFTLNPWRFAADFNLGRFYSGMNLHMRQDIGISPLWFYEGQFTMHKFDYFAGNQTGFFANRIPGNIEESETFLTVSAGMPVNIDRNILAKVNLTIGQNFFEYYQTDNFTTYDIPDRTTLNYISPSLTIERTTTNFKQYPTTGKRQKFSLRYTRVKENHKPGSTSRFSPEVTDSRNNTYSTRLFSETYYEIGKHFSLGVLADIAVSNRTYMGDHISTLLYLPAFQPSPHNATLLLNGYRATSFAGFALKPVIKFSETIFLHMQGGVFIPHRQLIETTDGVAKFTSPFPGVSFLASAAAVWQSPAGPVSLSATYYERSQVKWFPQFNIGFLIFKPKALAN
jgi:NTE family protein